jgi:uncharacterized membrane protein
MNLAVYFLYAIGSVVCHQLPERSFHIDGHQLPVCARCTGLYLSAAAGALGWCMWKVARRWRPVSVPPRSALRLVMLCGLPTAISVATAAIGAWDGSNAARALLSVPLGASAGAVVAAVFTKDLR